MRVIIETLPEYFNEVLTYIRSIGRVIYINTRRYYIVAEVPDTYITSIRMMAGVRNVTPSGIVKIAQFFRWWRRR